MSKAWEVSQILYEDNHLIVVNKKPSQIVQGDKTGDQPLNEDLKAYLKDTYQKPGAVFLGTVHRIDRPVSGIVLFAKTSKALTRLNEMFQKKEIRKTYWAVVGQPPLETEAVLTHYLYKNEQQNKSYALENIREGALKSELMYRLLYSINRYHLLEVMPFTGRHHQIRVQLSAIGSPIKGDVKYGFKRPNLNGSIHLHARKIEFLHPVKREKICIVAPPPDEKIWNTLINGISRQKQHT